MSSRVGGSMYCAVGIKKQQHDNKQETYGTLSKILAMIRIMNYQSNSTFTVWVGFLFWNLMVHFVAEENLIGVG